MAPDDADVPARALRALGRHRRRVAARRGRGRGARRRGRGADPRSTRSGGSPARISSRPPTRSRSSRSNADLVAAWYVEGRCTGSARRSSSRTCSSGSGSTGHASSRVRSTRRASPLSIEPECRWLAPASLDEALVLKAERGDEATVLAGGTFLGDPHQPASRPADLPPRASADVARSRRDRRRRRRAAARRDGTPPRGRAVVCGRARAGRRSRTPSPLVASPRVRNQRDRRRRPRRRRLRIRSRPRCSARSVPERSSASTRGRARDPGRGADHRLLRDRRSSPTS